MTVLAASPEQPTASPEPSNPAASEPTDTPIKPPRSRKTRVRVEGKQVNINELTSIVLDFKLLADTNRLELLSLLGQEPELSVNQLVEKMGVTRNMVNRCLVFLKAAGFIDLRRDGRKSNYFVVVARLEESVDRIRSALGLI